MIYDPVDINNAMNQLIEKDIRTDKINKCLYDNYLYTLLIITFINHINLQRNKKIRTDIINDIKNIKKNTSNLHVILEQYPDDLKRISYILSKFNSEKEPNNIHINLSTLVFTENSIIELIDKSIFDFDRLYLLEMKKMEYSDLLNALTNIFDLITVDAEPEHDTEFPNIMLHCSSDLPYCEGDKLMIKKNKLLPLLKIMAADILNPQKSKYIFNPIFTKNIIDAFRLTNRTDEIVTITL